MDDGTPHQLLLVLAGRVDDDLLGWARELVAVGEDARAVELVTATLIADRAVLPQPVRDALVHAGHSARTDLDAATALPPAGPDDGPTHRFDADVAPQVEAAVNTLSPHQVQGCRVLLTSRLTPAGTAPGPLPHPLLLVEVEEGGRPTDVLAYQLAAALDRAGVHASVEVLTAGRPVTEYHAAARRAARPIGSGTAPTAVEERPFVASWAGTAPPAAPRPAPHQLPPVDAPAAGASSARPSPVGAPTDDPGAAHMPTADVLSAEALFADSPTDGSGHHRAVGHTTHQDAADQDRHAEDEADLIGALPLEPVPADDRPRDREPVDGELFAGEPHPLARSTEYNPRSRPSADPREATEPGVAADTPVRLVRPEPSPFGRPAASPSPFDDIAPGRDRRGPVWPASEGPRRMPGASRSRPTVTPISRGLPSGPLAAVPAATTGDPAGPGRPSHNDRRPTVAGHPIADNPIADNPIAEDPTAGTPMFAEIPDPLNDPLTTPLLARLLDPTFPDIDRGAADSFPEPRHPGVPGDQAPTDEVPAGARPVEHQESWSAAWASGAWAMPRSAMPQPAMPQPAMPQPAMPQPAMPQSAMPQSAMPQSAMPQSAMPSPATAVPPVLSPAAASEGAASHSDVTVEPETPEPWAPVHDSVPDGTGTAELRAVPERRTPARHRVDDRGDTGDALFTPGTRAESSASDDLRPDRPRPDPDPDRPDPRDQHVLASDRGDDPGSRAAPAAVLPWPGSPMPMPSRPHEVPRPVRPTPFPLRPAPQQPGNHPPFGIQPPPANPPPRPVPRPVPWIEPEGDLEPEHTGTARLSDGDRDLLARLQSGLGHPPRVTRTARRNGSAHNGSAHNGSAHNGRAPDGRAPDGDEPPDLAG